MQGASTEKLEDWPEKPEDWQKGKGINTSFGERKQTSLDSLTE